MTRAKGSPRDMIRFVAGPGGLVVPDIKRKLPGRGVWVTGRAAVVDKAVKHKMFARGFKREVIVPAGLAAEVDALLSKDCLQSLSLANKAGQVITGFAKVEEAIASRALAGLVHASDCGAEGLRKLGQCLRRRYGDARAKPCVTLFLSSQLDLALGRSNVVHAALIAGAASEAFLECCRRLMAYRCETPLAEAQEGPPQEEIEELSGSLGFQRTGTGWAGTQD